LLVSSMTGCGFQTLQGLKFALQPMRVSLTANKIVEKAAWNAGAHGVPRASVRLLSTFGQAP
jgi:hypothetical protein